MLHFAAMHRAAASCSESAARLATAPWSERCPTADAIAARPELADAARVPYLLIVDLVAV